MASYKMSMHWQMCKSNKQAACTTACAFTSRLSATIRAGTQDSDSHTGATGASTWATASCLQDAHQEVGVNCNDQTASQHCNVGKGMPSYGFTWCAFTICGIWLSTSLLHCLCLYSLLCIIWNWFPINASCDFTALVNKVVYLWTNKTTRSISSWDVFHEIVIFFSHILQNCHSLFST